MILPMPFYVLLLLHILTFCEAFKIESCETKLQETGNGEPIFIFVCKSDDLFSSCFLEDNHSKLCKFAIQNGTNSSSPNRETLAPDFENCPEELYRVQGHFGKGQFGQEDTTICDLSVGNVDSQGTNLSALTAFYVTKIPY